jgi:TolA-binding protein
VRGRGNERGGISLNGEWEEMLRRTFLSGALIFGAVTTVDAQPAARSADAAFTRAQEMASDGNSAAGRLLVDSVIRATSPTSPIYPQALFYRATLATNAADAESDYRHIVVDYPLAPQAEDALLRLAQLELARGDRDDALGHLQRIPRDYPRSKSLARASYWIARVLFEKNDIAGACAANANAMAQTSEGEVELRNQIQYQSQRCASYAAAKDVTPPTVAADSSPPAAATTNPVQVPAKQPMTLPTKARDTEPSVVEPKTPVPTAAEVKNAPASAVGTRSYSVQVAAYNKKPQAEKLAASLEKRGYQARVDGVAAPFRVRIGRYTTAREAEVALKEIKSKGMAGFVARVP